MARLLFVTGTSPDVHAGSGTYVGISVLRGALEARGHTVDFLAPAAGKPVSLARRLLFNLTIRSAARPFHPDVVVGFDFDGLFLEDSGVPHVASIKGVIAEEAGFEQGLPRMRLTVEALLEQKHVRLSDRILATSRHSAAHIATGYSVAPERISVVPEPIDLARWQETLASAKKLQRSGRSVLCVAHLYPRKDVATLLMALKRLGSDVTLRIAGIGPELPRLQQLATALSLGSRVEFLGHVPFSRLAAEYRRADVFCLPSRQEGFGIVFLEAMAAGLPIVAARAAAVPEVVADGDSGILVSPGNPEEFASALERLLSDPTERGRLGAAGIDRVRSFDSPLVAHKFLQAVGLQA